MSRRTYYRTAAATAPPWWEQSTHHAPRDEVSQKVQAAIVSAISLTIIVFVVAAAVMVASEAMSLEALGWTALGSIVVGIMYGATLSLRWTQKTIVRPWQIEDGETKRRRLLEDLDRARADMLGATARQADQTSQSGPSVNVMAVALEILRRHFLGQDTTRSGCTKDGICTTSEWNLVSALFKSLGLKSRYTLTPGNNLLEAWTTFHNNVKVEDSQVWKRNKQGGWSIVE